MINLFDILRKWIAGSRVHHDPEISADVAKAQFDNLFDIAADGVIIFDHHQRIVRFNKGAEAIFGYTRAEAIGKPIDILLPPRFIESHKGDMRAFAAVNEAARLMGEHSEITGRRKSGEEFPAEASISTAVVNGQIVFYTILRDISQRRQAEAALRRSEERFRRIFEHSNDAILVVDPMGGRIINVNPTACRMFGFSSEEMTGMNIADIHPDDSLRFREFAQSVVKQGEGWADELTCLTKSGAALPVEISASLIDIGDRRLMIALFRNITERKEIERMNAFVSNVSHELKTPLTSMKMYSYLIALKPEKQEEYMKKLIREVERQEYIIKDLIRLSQLDHGKSALALSPTNLNEMAAEFVTDRTPLAQTRRLALTFEGKPHLPLVLADEGLLGQVLSILLTNAFNYTPVGEVVTVSTVSQGNAWAGFRVSDSGQGILPEDQAHLFERFYRGAAGRGAREPGTGLGLAIAKEIVEQHHGRIEVKSTGVPGEGTAFTVWLPMD